MSRQGFLFLQVDTSIFAARLADALAATGARIEKIHLCTGDLLFWPRRGARWYRGKAADWPGFVGSVMDECAITDLILTGEQRAYHRAAIAEARKRNINVTIHDLGYLRPDWIAFEQDGMATWSRFPRTPEAVRHLASTVPDADFARKYEDSFTVQAASDVAFHVSTAFLWFLFPHYRSFQPYGVVRGYGGTLWRLLRGGRLAAEANAAIARIRAAGTPYFVLPLQMEADFSLRAYSPFPDIVTPLQTVIASFARHAAPGTCLFVKLHPHDPGLRPWRRLIAEMAERNGIAGRVIFIDGGSLDALLEQAQGVVTVNSTVGIWALRAGVPVKVLGDAIFDMPGLTHQGSLPVFWTAPERPDPSLIADFLRAIAHTLHIRGVFYARAGREAAVRQAVERLRPENMRAMAALLGAAGGQLPRFAPIPPERAA